MTGTTLAEVMDAMPDDVAEIRRDMQRIFERLAAIEALMHSESQRCPNREAVARIVPATERITTLERDMVSLRIEVSKMSLLSGSAGGGIVGILGMVVLAVGKALKWW